MSGPRPVGAHLVGSVPLADAGEVFRLASSALGQHLRRIPDGETGDRTNWIAWQWPVFGSCPAFEEVPPEPGRYVSRGRLRLRPGHRGAIELGPLGYAEAARASYAVFRELCSQGVVAPGCRFQVCLPTPLAPIVAFLVPLNWLHLPVPRDPAYFAPLKGLAPGDTEIYLGLVHRTDGLEGSARRVAAAQQAVDFAFGVATECGLGRRPPETIPELLQIHAALAQPWV